MQANEISTQLQSDRLFEIDSVLHDYFMSKMFYSCIENEYIMNHKASAKIKETYQLMVVSE